MNDDVRFLAVAAAMARRGRGLTAENPNVGCVIVRDGRVLGRGVTQRGGRPHAETEALSMAAARYGESALRGATAYVTLEPCAHYGKTPPCADALIAAGIARVVVPMGDPDPRVSGRGFERLASAGIRVDLMPVNIGASDTLAGYMTRARLGRPHVTLKLATTLDGRIAMASGESRWITGPEARRRVHLMRAAADGVLIGSGTAMADDPLLDVRVRGLEDRAPLRIIADRRLRVSPDLRMLAEPGGARVLILGDVPRYPARAEALRARGAQLVACDAASNVATQLAALGLLGINAVLCEGGGGLAAALMQAGCVDRLCLITAGKAIGAAGEPAIGMLDAEKLADVPQLMRIGIEALGADIMTVWEPVAATT